MNKANKATTSNIASRLLKRMKAQTLNGIPIVNEERSRDKYSDYSVKEVLLRTSFGAGDSIQDERELRDEQDKERLPSERTVRRRLKRKEDADELATQVNHWALKKFRAISRRYLKQKVFITIDRHDEPWYGDEDNVNVKGGRRKSSTSYFWSVVGLYVVHPIRPLLIATRPVRKTESQAEIFQKMLKDLKPILDGIHNLVVLADGKYYKTDLIRQLRDSDHDYIIRAHKRGKVKNWAVSDRAKSLKLGEGFLKGHSLFSHKYGTCSTHIAIVNRDGTVIGLATSLPKYGAKRILKWYKRRFRIENCFRDMRPYLIRTSSDDPVLRFAYIFWAMILWNIIQIHLLEFVPSRAWKLGHFMKCPVKQLLISIHISIELM